MSKETFEKLENAIREHIQDVYTNDSVLTDWFLGYGLMAHSQSAHNGISYSFEYQGSETSPQGVLGIGRLTLDKLKYDMLNARSDADEIDETDES